ncbi:hypothetical protein KOW79_022776 [Hemibagrus wyckioides]|uniref:SEA domain-containing protein n=2 Tax=Hemibagrus wyckioides TaxID=337641 RepID=A0A9D3N4D4_9TELE|nr:hypothetical protein KOW79_022776 [Hemibagrus wyckioides]
MDTAQEESWGQSGQDPGVVNSVDDAAEAWRQRDNAAEDLTADHGLGVFPSERTLHICYLKTPEIINNTMDWRVLLTILCLTVLISPPAMTLDTNTTASSSSANTISSPSPDPSTPTAFIPSSPSSPSTPTTALPSSPSPGPSTPTAFIPSSPSSPSTPTTALPSSPSPGPSTPTAFIPSSPSSPSTPTTALPSSTSPGSSTPTSAITLSTTTGSSTSTSAIPSSTGSSTTSAATAVKTSTDATTTSTTITSTTVSPAAVFLLIFSVNESFVPALANPNSQQFKDKANNISSEVGPLYKKTISTFLFMKINGFRSGSIVTNSSVLFSSGNVTSAQVKESFVSGLSNLTFKVDPSSVSVTQTVGNSTPPVIASSVFMICMSLLSLLLSFALHF